MKMRKTITISLRITAPVGMTAAQIRTEAKTRITDVAPHFDAFSLRLPDSAEGADGYIRLRAANAKRPV